MQHNQVFVIQVSSGTKGPLALPPPPPDSLLPSEVKYSASLVRGLGFTHLVLGSVLFLLGVLGTWVEPETCWSGAGVWAGLVAICCGFSGLVAHHLWYKNATIKSFLVLSVAGVITAILAMVLTIYAIVHRHQHHLLLLQQAEALPWFQPYDLEKEHRLTLSVSVNQLVGFGLELLLALWSAKVGWRGVRAPEFSAARRDSNMDDQQSVVSLPRPGQQVPLAALYQLLQAHPELLGNKALGGSLGTPWATGLEERPPHHSMDYKERVNRFLSHAIEDQNQSFSRSSSMLHSDNQDASPTASSSTIESGGRGSPAETVIMLSDPPARSPKQKKDTAPVHDNILTEKGQKPNKVYNMKRKNNTEHKVKAPAPKHHSTLKENENSAPTKKIQEKEAVVIDDGNTEGKMKTKPYRKSEQDTARDKRDQQNSVVVKEDSENTDSKQIREIDQKNKKDFSKRTEKHKVTEIDKVIEISKVSDTEGSENAENTNPEQNTEDKPAKTSDVTMEITDIVETEKNVTEKNNQSVCYVDDKCEPLENSPLNQLHLIMDIQPPCEFQDT